jgi:tetratricopeptide (TPR) repeat protein
MLATGVKQEVTGESSMRSGKKIWALALFLAAVLAFTLAPRAMAQNDGTISGQIMDVEGKPWPEIAIQIVSDQGSKAETKTDKSGNFSFHNLRSGLYDVSIVLPQPNQPYKSQTRVQAGGDAKVNINFKDVVGKQGAEYQEKLKKQEDEKNKFEGLKAHFAEGNKFLEQERAAKADLSKAPADQRDAAKQTVADLSDKAVAEFQAAQKSAGEKDTNLHLVYAKLGEAYDVAGRNDEAIAAYQQAVTAKPDVPGYYNNMGNVLARAGKIDEAKAAYTKSAELDPPNAAGAWLNFGISLSNAGRLKEAVEPLKKATDIDPKNAKAWYLLATAMVGSMETKKVGDKLEFTVLPGTVEAYQQAVELDPNGQWGQQAKQGLEGLQAMAPGIETKVSNKKKKN